MYEKTERGVLFAISSAFFKPTKRFLPPMNVNAESWPAFQVERRKVADLKPFKNNARTHSKEQVAQIAASTKEWGFTNPILID